ncbi:MAG: hypothetical protein R3B40_07270 [Polyangiales bacterium]
MIPVRFSSEPAALATVRTRKLQKAIDAHARGDTVAVRALLDGYDASGVKAQLFVDQNKRCAYCERPCGFASLPIEHFRPKKLRLREDRSVDDERYWWLTWTWENLVFACGTCNGSSFKGNHFALEDESCALTPPGSMLDYEASVGRLGDETAKLLDPRRDDPHRHLRWAPVDRSIAPALWSWTLVPLTPRGAYTARIVDVGGTVDEVTNEWVGVWRDAQPFLAVAQGVGPAPTTEWDDLCAHVLRRGVAFPFARWWMLNELRAMPAVAAFVAQFASPVPPSAPAV